MKNMILKISLGLFIAFFALHAWVTYRIVVRMGVHEAYIINIVQTIQKAQP